MTDYKYTSLKYINLSLGIISIIFCLLTIISFITFKKIRSFILELVIYLSFSSLLQTIAFIIYFPENNSESHEKLCQYQAFGMELFGLSQFLWTCIISFSIFQSVINLKNYSLENNNLILTRFVYIFIGFGIPLIISLFGYLFDLYGVAGFWCFIYTDKDKSNNIIFNKYFFFYLITFTLLWLCIIFNIVLNTIVIKYLRNTLDEDEGNRIKYYTRPLMFYSIIQIICIFPTTIIRIYQLFNSKYIVEFEYIQSIFDVSQGFMYSLAYGFNPIVKRGLKGLIRKITKKDNTNDSYYEYENYSRKFSSKSAIKSNLDFSFTSTLD